MLSADVVPVDDATEDHLEPDFFSMLTSKFAVAGPDSVTVWLAIVTDVPDEDGWYADLPARASEPV